MTLRIAIADHEFGSRLQLQTMLRGHADIEVCPTSQTDSLMRTLKQFEPDALFVDPRALEPAAWRYLTEDVQPTPSVVVLATPNSPRWPLPPLGLLNKPFVQTEVDASIEKLRDKFHPQTAFPEKIPLPIGRRIEIVAVKDISYLRADGNYVAVHVGAREFILRTTMAQMQAKLNPKDFFRAHRSSLVRVDKIVSLESLPSNRTKLKLDCGITLVAGRFARAELYQRVGMAA